MASTELRAAAQQALEALEMESNPTAVVEVAAGRWELKSDLAIAALRAALAEPVQAPVAYASGRTLHWHEGKGVNDVQLYLAPPQRPAEPVQEPVQQALCEADRIMGHDDEATEWRERWGHLFKAPPQRNPVEWDGRCMLGHCNSPAGCENSGECRAVERAHKIGGEG